MRRRGNRDWTGAGPRDRARARRAVPLPLRHAPTAPRRRAASAPRYPAGSREPVRIAFFSCQEFVAGSTTRTRDLADADVDLVVCLGDYVYEKAYGSAGARDATAPDGETQTLAEYRAQVLALPHRRAPARGPPAVSRWSRSGTTTRSRTTTPASCPAARPTTAACRSPSAARNGYRAFFEHMPRRLRADFRTYGRIRSATPSCSCSTRASSAATSRAARPTPRPGAVPADHHRRPERARCSARPEGVAEGRAERLARALEARRQPGDDHFARRAAAQPAQHRLVGRLRRRPSARYVDRIALPASTTSRS